MSADGLFLVATDSPVGPGSGRECEEFMPRAVTHVAETTQSGRRRDATVFPGGGVLGEPTERVKDLLATGVWQASSMGKAEPV